MGHLLKSYRDIPAWRWGGDRMSLAEGQALRRAAAMPLAQRTGCPQASPRWGRQPHQGLRPEVPDDGVLTDGQVVLVAAEEQAVVHGVAHQVDAGAHDQGGDADVDQGAGRGAGAPLHELRSEGAQRRDPPY